MNTRSRLFLIAGAPSLLLATLSVAALAGAGDVPYQFVPGTVADANQVNDNFSAIAAVTADNDRRIADLEATIVTLQSKLAERDDMLQHFSRKGNDIYLTGANLHVVNGTGTTDGTVNGLGNIIIGYNEERTYDGDPETLDTNNRTGSHMLVVGAENNFTHFGGIVTGWRNSTEGEYASVSGGAGNRAIGQYASVSGGWQNAAAAVASTVGGGYRRPIGGLSANNYLFIAGDLHGNP